MGTLNITLTNTTVYASYMGGKAVESPINDAWIHILKSLILGGDIIEVLDEREKTFSYISDLSFSFNTDTAERILPKSKEMINPLYDLDALVNWLERNPEELKRLTKLINE